MNESHCLNLNSFWRKLHCVIVVGFFYSFLVFYVFSKELGLDMILKIQF